MDSLNNLEITVLEQIADQYPDARMELRDLFRSCGVSKRENTGAGFFTTLVMQAEGHPPLRLRSPLGDVFVAIDGLRYGIGCLVFLKHGYPCLLEGYALAAEGTSNIDFGTVDFTVRLEPPT